MGPTESKIAAPHSTIGDTDRSSEEIRDNIERTRSRMDRAIDNLSERVDPKAVWDGVVNCFKSESDGANVARDTAQAIIRPIRENPAAAIALGASAVWLISGSMGSDEDDDFELEHRYNPRGEKPTDDQVMARINGSRSSGSESDSSDDSGIVDTAKQKVTEAGTAVAEGLSSAKSAVTGKVNEATDAASETLATARDRVAENYESAKQSARMEARRARRQTRELYGNASQTLSDTVASGRERYHRGLRENPLGLMVGALGIGLLAGVLAPVSRREEELFGEYSDTVTNKLKSTGDELVEKGKRAGERVAQTALDEVEKADIDTSKLSELAEDVKETVTSAASSVREEAEKAAEDEDLTATALKEKVEPNGTPS